MIKSYFGVVCVIAASCLWPVPVADAARPAGDAQDAAQAAPSARAAAPLDLTGYWVSLVTEDWRWRVVTPPVGDVLYLPVNAAGRKAAEAWDPARDEAGGEACRAFGAGGVMRLPGRLHITWADDETLTVETDAGSQTRRFFFQTAPPLPEPTWQGRSAASWQYHGVAPRGRTPAPASRRTGELRVITDQMRPGYQRRNGVPYSGQARLTEHWNTLTEPDGSVYLIVTTILEDPIYLAAPYVRSYQFRKQADATGWNPTACAAL